MMCAGHVDLSAGWCDILNGFQLYGTSAYIRSLSVISGILVLFIKVYRVQSDRVSVPGHDHSWSGVLGHTNKYDWCHGVVNRFMTVVRSIAN